MEHRLSKPYMVNMALSSEGSLTWLNTIACGVSALGVVPPLGEIQEAVDRHRDLFVHHILRQLGYPHLYGILRDRCGVGSRGCEIGVYVGDNAVRLIHFVEPSSLHLVDPYVNHGIEGDAWTGPHVAQEEVEGRMKIMLDRIERTPSSCVVNFHRMTSAEYFAQADPDSLDWIYIDGNHNEQFVVDDINGALECVRVGGIISGDDHTNATWKPHIEAAWKRIDPTKYKVIYDETEPWIWERVS